MKTTFRNRAKLLIVAFTSGFVLGSVSQSSSQQLKQVSEPPRFETFWLPSFQLENQPSPPYPFDSYGGLLPIREMKGCAGQYVVADSPEDYQQLQNETSLALTRSSLESDGPPVPGDGEGNGGADGRSGISYSPMVFTNAPESLLFDTMSSTSNGVLPSWRDVRAFPVPDGMALGILVATNCPFELTRIVTEVLFENPGSLPDTEIEVGFFRGTNQFHYAMYLDPEYIVSDVEGTLSKTLTDLGDGRWLLSLDLPTYAWGTNRVLTIRTVPNSNGTMAKMSLIASSETIPGITAYASDNRNNLVQVPLPKMQVWRRMLSATRSVSYETFLTDFELTMLPGYQLGNSTNLALPFDWQTDDFRNWRTTVDIILLVAGIAFLLMRPPQKPKADAPQTISQEAKVEAPQPISPAVEKAHQASVEPAVTNDLLRGAYRMAAFIDQVLDSVPRERVATRDHLKGIQAVFFVSDYVMAAKTNSSLVLSETAIVAAFTNVTQDTSFIRDRLRLWAVRPSALTDHYQSISEIPAEKENIKALKGALTENGVAIDTESDLLMDWIRFAVHNTDIYEMYGPNPRRMEEVTPFPAALNSLIDTGDAVFRHRFTEKFGMNSRTVINLMNRIKDLRIYNLSPSDVEIPVVHFQ